MPSHITYRVLYGPQDRLKATPQEFVDTMLERRFAFSLEEGCEAEWGTIRAALYLFIKPSLLTEEDWDWWECADFFPDEVKKVVFRRRMVEALEAGYQNKFLPYIDSDETMGLLTDASFPWYYYGLCVRAYLESICYYSKGSAVFNIRYKREKVSTNPT